MTKDEQLAWGSHLPALLACIGATTGPVLELGVGHFSTPVLHALLGASHRRLYSVEESTDWWSKFAHFDSDRHRVIKVLDYCQWLADSESRGWSVAFIDNSPGGEGRSKPFELLLPVSDYVVVHDHWRENEEAIAPLLKGVKFHVTRTYKPPTLVASLTRAIPESILIL